MSCRRLRVVVAALPLLLASRAAGAVDLTGKWRLEATSASFVEIVPMTQTGSTLSFTFAGYAFSGSVTPVGTFTNYDVIATPPTARMSGRVMPSGNLLDGHLAVVFPPNPMPFVGGVVGTRCTCDDGNTTPGDGCDATCQVEPCWTCTGAPSVCAPTSDGSPCEDGSVCTSGETCAAGACQGGVPVAPCVDMTGRWNRHGDTSSVPGATSYDVASDITQRGTDVVFREPGFGLASYVGTIDPATGAFDLRVVNPAFFCSGFDPLTGVVAPNGATYAASGTIDVTFPDLGDQCGTYPFTETGTRCGSGAIDAGEACDDGNLTAGDGCSATCQVEQCWTCSGAPSVCTPTAGAPCDDGAGCTTGDTCTSAGACVGAAVACGPCLACDGMGGCVPAPRSPCKSPTRPDKSILAEKNVAEDGKDVLSWTWRAGPVATLPELGNPPGGDGFVLCVYDETNPTPGLLFRATLPGGGTCDGGPCWRPKGGDGFVYKNTAATPEGVIGARLRAGDVASAVVKAKGVHLSDRAYALPHPPIPTPLRVQLQGDGGLCAEARYLAGGVVKNDPARGTFKARGAP